MTSDSPGCLHSKWVGQADGAFASSGVLCWAHSDSWAGSGCRHRPEKSPGSLVRQGILLSPMAVAISSKGYGQDWNKCSGKRERAKEMYTVSSKVKRWAFRAARSPVTFHRGFAFLPVYLLPFIVE